MSELPDIAIYSYTTPDFSITVRATQNAITGISFGEAPLDIPKRENPLTIKACNQIMEYLCGKRHQFELPLLLQGTGFQMAVWQELQKIPYGTTKSYAEIAAGLGKPRAARAAGGAIHNNPIAIVVPCHRVIGANGSLTGFAGGLAIKQKLLQLESG